MKRKRPCCRSLIFTIFYQSDCYSYLCIRPELLSIRLICESQKKFHKMYQNEFLCVYNVNLEINVANLFFCIFMSEDCLSADFRNLTSYVSALCHVSTFSVSGLPEHSLPHKHTHTLKTDVCFDP